MNNTIDICICTYRRPHVAETLRSLTRLMLPSGWKFQIIVADNDDTPSARVLVEGTAPECTYTHAPANNISIARNACLDASKASFLAFLDDDETATPSWLEALTTCMENEKADVVLGPVNAIYAPNHPDWMKNGDFHSTRPVWVNGKIITGYAGNVLIRRTSPALQNLRFEEQLGRTGGEDTVFFSSAYKAGAKIAYARDAIVNEIVPDSRTSLGWLLKRSFRSGQTHGLLLLQKTGGFIGRMENIVLAGAKSFFCLIMTLFTMRGERRIFWMMRGSMHAGVVAQLLGMKTLQFYGKP